MEVALSYRKTGIVVLKARSITPYRAGSGLVTLKKVKGLLCPLHQGCSGNIFDGPTWNSIWPIPIANHIPSAHKIHS